MVNLDDATAALLVENYSLKRKTQDPADAAQVILCRPTERENRTLVFPQMMRYSL
jgi:hypothetical protein